MGRGVRKLELIKKESVRRSTFKKRKLNLEKKLHELTTLCDVSACMIVCGPKQDVGLEECHVWPENPGELLRAYSDRNQESSHKTFGLSDFYGQRKKKAEEELDTMRRENSEAKYPTRPEILNSLDEAQLRQFAAALKSKAEYVKSRIETIKRSALRLSHGFSQSSSSIMPQQEIPPENFWLSGYEQILPIGSNLWVNGQELSLPTGYEQSVAMGSSFWVNNDYQRSSAIGSNLWVKNGCEQSLAIGNDQSLAMGFNLWLDNGNEQDLPMGSDLCVNNGHEESSSNLWVNNGYEQTLPVGSLEDVLIEGNQWWEDLSII